MHKKTGSKFNSSRSGNVYPLLRGIPAVLSSYLCVVLEELPL
jgi:hypothetical protein